MKYIRMKDGRIVNQYQTIRPQFVVKRADTIEELCDGFRIKCSDGTYYSQIMATLDQAKYWLSQDKGITIYGCIETDKGLIYVAKMNEKGESELL